MVSVDLLADVGEGFGAYEVSDDEALFPILTSANVACGFHAGDPRIMERTVRSCLAHGVSIGAHPGFPDLNGFGRRSMELTPTEVRTDVLYQVGALAAFARAQGARLNHVTLHGRLGNLSQVRQDYAEAVADAIAQLDPSLIVVARGQALIDAARQRSLSVRQHVLGDRSYNDDGTLVARSKPGAVIDNPEVVVERILRMVVNKEVVSANGSVIDVECDAVLLHGDTPHATDLARRVRRALEEAGVYLRAMKANAADDSAE